MKRKAFTLIEVLVVLAIVALLIAILIPSLSAARRSSQPLPIRLESNAENHYDRIPLKATDVDILGNDWFEFTLNGNRWLYHHRWDTSSSTSELLFLVPKEQ